MAKTNPKQNKVIDRTLNDLVDATKDLYEACKMQQRLINDMMPGVPNIALPDYTLLIDAPVAATEAIRQMELLALHTGKELSLCQPLQKH